MAAAPTIIRITPASFMSSLAKCIPALHTVATLMSPMSELFAPKQLVDHVTTKLLQNAAILKTRRLHSSSIKADRLECSDIVLWW